MQSELWKNEVLASNEPPPETTTTVASLTDPTDSLSASVVNQSAICSSNNGLGEGLSILDTESYQSGVCAVTDLSYIGGTGSNAGDEC